MSDYLFKRSGYLFAKPSFIEGASRVMDMGSTLDSYNTCETGEQADTEAMRNDWLAVGEDIARAMDKFATKEG